MILLLETLNALSLLGELFSGVKNGTACQDIRDQGRREPEGYGREAQGIQGGGAGRDWRRRDPQPGD